MPALPSRGLLWAAGARDLARADAVVAGYRSHVRLEPGELARLAGAIRARPLVFESWAFCTGRKQLADVARDLPATHDLADAIAARAGRGFADPATQAGASDVPYRVLESGASLERGAGTGRAIAAIRAEETARPDRIFADPPARAFVAGSGWSAPSRPADRRAAALKIWVVARTVFLDDLLAAACRDGCRQVVLLGAGFDARAFRLPWPPGLRCFELDTADDRLRWLAGHGWTPQVTSASEVLRARGRPVQAAGPGQPGPPGGSAGGPAPGSPANRRPRALLVSAARDASVPRRPAPDGS